METKNPNKNKKSTRQIVLEVPFVDGTIGKLLNAFPILFVELPIALIDRPKELALAATVHL